VQAMISALSCESQSARFFVVRRSSFAAITETSAVAFGIVIPGRCAASKAAKVDQGTRSLRMRSI
jgi:hypothetical protein